MYRIALILALALFAASCGGRRSRPQQTACVSQPRVFLPAIAPARLSPQEQRDYLRWHYWTASISPIPCSSARRRRGA